MRDLFAGDFHFVDERSYLEAVRQIDRDIWECRPGIESAELASGFAHGIKQAFSQPIYISAAHGKNVPDA